MKVCQEQVDRILTFLDRELGAEETEALERHLESCAGCREFLVRHGALDQLLHQPPAVAEDGRDELITHLHARLSEEQPSRRISYRIVLALTSAAAVLLLTWAFHLTFQGKEVPDETDFTKETVSTIPGKTVADSGETGKATQQVAEKEKEKEAVLTLREIADEDRIQARQALSTILIGLAETPEDELAAAFTEATVQLRKKGWNVKQMLAGALRREEDPALLSAIRLAACLPGFDEAPGAISALETHLESGIHPMECMAAIAVLDGARGEEALGRALMNPIYRDQALAHLSKLEGKGPVQRVRRALELEGDLSQGEPSPFALQAVAYLSRMGREGVDEVVNLFHASSDNLELLRGLKPADGEFSDHLTACLEKKRGRALASGCRLAAALRLEDGIDIFLSRQKDSALQGSAPFLVAMVGRYEAVKALVDEYRGPVSLRQRIRLSEATASVFDLYPEETSEILYRLMQESDFEMRHVLIEMLSRSEGKGACEALAWFIEHVPALASEAALALARTRSEDALDRLVPLLGKESLDARARLAAAAAAYHLGGSPVLSLIRGEETTLTSIELKKPQILGPHAGINLRRFKKLEKYIQRIVQ